MTAWAKSDDDMGELNALDQTKGTGRPAEGNNWRQLPSSMLAAVALTQNAGLA